MRRGFLLCMEKSEVEYPIQGSNVYRSHQCSEVIFIVSMMSWPVCDCLACTCGVKQYLDDDRMSTVKKGIVMISLAISIVIQHCKTMQLAMEYSFHRGTIANVTQNPLPSPQPRYHIAQPLPKIINTSTYIPHPEPRADVTNSITVTESMESSSMHA